MDSLEKDVAACLTFLLANRSKWEIAEDGERSDNGGTDRGGATCPRKSNSSTRRLSDG